MSARRLPLAVLAALVAGTSPLAAQRLDPPIVRPLPPETPILVFRGPELGILEVRRVGPATEPVRVGDIVPVEVVVRNVGTAEALVKAGTPGSPRHGEGLVRYGRTMPVRPGETVALPLDLRATGNLFRDGRFEADVFLFDGSRRGEGPVLPLFRDAVESDNRFRASFPFAPPVVGRAEDDCPYGAHGCNRCVPDVPAAFDAASGSGDQRHSFAFAPRDRALNGPVPDAFHVRDHIQGLARIPGLLAENVVALSRNARDVGDAAVYLARFDRIESRGDAWKWAVSRRSDDASSYWYHRIAGANHAGGMQALGTMLFVAVDCDEGHRCPAFVEVLDVRDPSHARALSRLSIDGSRGELHAFGRPLASRAAAVAAIRQSDGRVLLFVRGRWDDEVGRFDGWFFRSEGADIGPGTRWELVDHWTSTEMPRGDARNPWESAHFLGECGTGAIYLIAMGADGNTSFLYRLHETPVDGGRRGNFRFERVAGRGLNPSGVGPLTASTRYGGGVHVTPGGAIVSYITDRQPTVGIDEFRPHGEHGS